jgi:hypothetical protein
MGSRRDGWMQRRLGMPRTSGQRPLVTALVVDSLGDGLFVPFAIVYFLHTMSLSLAAIGACLSVAGLLALPSVLLAGVLVDRFSSTRVVVAGNLLSGLAFADLRGRYLGTYQLSWALSRAVAPALFTWLFSAGADLPWIVLAVGCAGWTALLSLPRLSVLRARLRL